MEITAKTQDGYLIQASSNEIKEILTSVNGKCPKKIEIGQKIPAIDYATTITKIKALKDNYEFKNMFKYLKRFYGSAKELQDKVVKANNIEV